MNSSRPRALPTLLALALAAGCLATALLLAAGSAGGASKERPPLMIGALFSRTGPGGTYGPGQLKAAELAVAQVNAAGGVDGAPLHLDAVDDRSDPAYGAEQMRALIEKEKVLAVLGPTLSLVAVEAHPVANGLKTPVLSVSNTADGIVGRCPYPCEWIWRDSLGASTAVPGNITQYVQANHPSSAVIAYTGDDDDPAGDSEAAAAERTFGSENVRVLAKLSIPISGSPRAVVAKVSELKPRVLFLATSYAHQAVEIMRETRADGFRGAFLGGDAFNSAVLAKLAGRAGAGAQSGVAWYPGNDFPANAQFVTAYRQAYSTQPDQFDAWAYAGIEILASALRNAHLAGSTAPLPQQRSDIQKALGATALMTPMGPFRFTAGHDVDQIVWVHALDGHGGHRLVGFCDGREGVVSAGEPGC